MFRRLCVLTALVAITAAPALASLPVGAVAPNFTAPASLGGKVYTFNLAAALKKGPVVLYFYPAAFTKGCTIEAHTFAVAMPQFRALHATVIGVSRDPIAKLQRFSTSVCRSKFPVAADQTGAIVKEYDATLPGTPVANRISYVIAPSGKIIYTYTNMTKPQAHVANALAALRKFESH